MSNRRALLEELFRRLNAQSLPYCVLRNYERLFDDSSSDVDLLTLPATADAVIECCRQAGEPLGWTLVQRTRFVNHSLVFWDGGRGFVRIDIDTEKRWKRFHLLTAAQVLATRRPRECFFVPGPAEEVVVILTQALWQGKVTERYAARLAALRLEVDAAGEAARMVFWLAFGPGARWPDPAAEPDWRERLEARIRRNVFTQPARLWHSLRYVAKDAVRLKFRRQSPPGLFVRGLGVSAEFAESLKAELSILFPLKKSRVQTRRMANEERRQTLFKGGLAIELLPESLKPAAALAGDWQRPDRSFAVISQPAGGFLFAHAGTGFTATGQNAAEFTRFICEVLAHRHAARTSRRRGAFVVLLGLDGSGKTTLARHLTHCDTRRLVPAGVRYFHFRPKCFSCVELPLPDLANQPRKPPLKQNLINAGLSAARLARNVLLANIAWWCQVRPLLRRGCVVLVDRYFYNYRLDPASVKYAGPDWLLALAEKFFPQPEVVIVLRAPAEVLRARKQELSREEITRQAAVLDRLQFGNAQVLAVDASQPADEVARATMNALAEIVAGGERSAP